ncbi:hypothetical protein WJX77_012388 [Trebouxia sp. C0004]
MERSNDLLLRTLKPEATGFLRQVVRQSYCGLHNEDCVLGQGSEEAGLLDMEEIWMLAAFAKQQMTTSHSVRLSKLDPSLWGHIRKNAGLLLKPYIGEISGLELQPATPFQWSEAPEASQVCRLSWDLRTPPDSPSSSSSDVVQENVVSLQSKAACQAMAALLLANIHAPDFKPAITLTDLKDSHSIFWLDGLSIMYYAAPDAATAWALAKALLVRDPEGHSNNLS